MSSGRIIQARLCCVLVCLFMLSWAWAEEEPAPLRDPFWPVGYQPPRSLFPGDADPLQEEVEEWPELRVRGRSRAPDGTVLALVAGVGIVRAGDVVSVEQRGLWFHFRITHLDQQTIRFIRLGVSKEKDPGEDWLRAREADPEQREETGT